MSQSGLLRLNADANYLVAVAVHVLIQVWDEAWGFAFVTCSQVVSDHSWSSKSPGFSQ